MQLAGAAGDGEMAFKSRALAAGETAKCKITVKTPSGKSTSLTVTLVGDESKAPALTGVTLRPAGWLQVGKTETLKPVLNPAKPADANLLWRVAEYNPDGTPAKAGAVLTVAPGGKITATGTGTAVVTATGAGGAQDSTVVYCIARQ